MEQRNFRIDRFDPLLRDLLAWGLVEKDDATDEPVWRLHQRAQERLSELVRAASPLVSDRVVYLDHLCADCRQRRPTRLVDGSYVCDACQKVRLESATHGVATEAATDPQASRTRRRPLNRTR